MKLYDTHAHLNDPIFADDLNDVLKRARDAGVCMVNIVGWDIQSSRDAIRVSEKYPDILRAIVGFHPNYSAGWRDSWLSELEKLLENPLVVGIGEIGMDAYWSYASLSDQEKAFRSQLMLAKDKGLPVVLHIRKAFDRVLPILEEMRPQKALFHAFSGGTNEALWATERGYPISVTGVIVLGSKRLRSVVRRIGLSWLVAETDCPYISPIRGHRNEPANVRLVVEKISELLNTPVGYVAQVIWENSSRFFLNAPLRSP
ncbi:MAG: TatD family hydrolase [candidate division WOR-3 bacterium]